MTEKQDVFAGPLAALESDIIGRRPESVVRAIKPIERDPLGKKPGEPPIECDPLGKKPGEPGAKLDHGKVRVMRGAIQYFPRALRAVAVVSEYGATKYTWDGWRSVPDGVDRYSDALARHLIAERIEGAMEMDTGLLHAAQVAWNALARLELMLRHDP